MKIRDIMRSPFTILDTDTLGTAERAMARWQIRHLPVVSGGRILGMLSQRDILAARAHADPDEDWWTLRVHDAMSQPVQTCGPDDSLTEVAGRLASAKISALPVVDVGKLIGIVTVTDVLEGEVRLAMGPSSAPRTIAGDVMTPLPQTVSPETSLVEAVTRMVDHRIRHLPVVDASSKVVGMLSERDVRSRVGDPILFTASTGNGIDKAIAKTLVKDVMSKPAIAVPFDRPLSEVAHSFAEHRIGAVPVVDKSGALVGIVSYIDALRIVGA